MGKKARTIKKLIKKWFSKNPDITPNVKTGILDLIKELVEPDEVFNLSVKAFKPLFKGLRKIAESNLPLKQSLVCIAFKEHASEELLQHLYDKEFTQEPCATHPSVWSCAATQIHDEDMRREIVQILTGYHVDHIRYFKYEICNAIRKDCDAHQVEMLLGIGARLNDCVEHANGLLCATESLIKCKLRADVIKIILDQRCPQHAKQLNEDGFTPLQLALEQCFDYEAKAIFLLLDQPHVEVNDTANPKGGNLLHYAVNNPYCKLSVVERLVRMGARVDMVNKNGDTPLHVAVKKQSRQPSIVQFLIESGSPINAVNNNNKTALELAVIRGRNYDMLKMLLIENADTHVSDDESEHAMLKLALRLYDNNQNCFTFYTLLEVFKTLVKFQFLSEKNFDIEPVIKGRTDFLTLYNYAESCADELSAMESEMIGDLCVRGFVQEVFLSSGTKPQKTKKTLDVVKLLSLRADVRFPIYFDVIATMLLMMPPIDKDKLLHNLLYAVKDSPPEGSSKPVEVVLYHHCTHAIAKYLSDTELLKTIMAFLRHADGSPCGSKRKFGLEQSLNPPKRRCMTALDLSKIALG